MRRNAIETLLGGVVLTVAVVFMFFALKSAQVSGVQGYELNAVFYKIVRDKPIKPPSYPIERNH